MLLVGAQNQLTVRYRSVVGFRWRWRSDNQTPFTLQSVLQMIRVFGVTIPQVGGQTQLRNTAASHGEPSFLRLARPGQQIDITVSSSGNPQF
jgi:flagellar P-ring protein precursor FlgI